MSNTILSTKKYFIPKLGGNKLNFLKRLINYTFLIHMSQSVQQGQDADMMI